MDLIKVLQLDTKLGTAIIETKTITLPNLNAGSFYELSGDILLYQIGDAGTAVAKSFFNFNFTDQQGDSKTSFIDETNNTTFQTTSDATADITINWNNQNVANIFKSHSLSFSKIY
jgi:hypothetical protein